MLSAMAKNRKETWLWIVVLGIGLIPTAIAGLWAYMSLTATALHPDPARVPSFQGAAPPASWRAAVEKAQAIVRTALKEKNLPGVSVAVGLHGDIVWAEGFGWAHVDDKQQIETGMSFRIGTGSIAFTSVAAALLLQDGRLKLDEPVQTYVPEYPQQAWPVTLGQLMADVAGVADDGGDEGPLFTKHCDRPADAWQYLSGYERELSFQPGTKYAASKYGWILVSAAIEAAARQPFLAFMKSRVFDPLGLRDTVADSAEAPTANRATPYFPRFAADPRYGLDLMRPLDYSCYAGASVFLSTPSDIVRFAMAINGDRFLKPETRALLHTSYRLASGADTGHGLGWDVSDVTIAGRKEHVIGRDGAALGGNVSSLVTIPSRGLAISVMSNTSYADTSAIALSVADAFASERTTGPSRAGS